MSLPKRALTPKMKRAVVERLLLAWEQVPEQRLGQLIDNAFGNRDMFHVEDFDFIEHVEQRAAGCGKK